MNKENDANLCLISRENVSCSSEALSNLHGIICIILHRKIIFSPFYILKYYNIILIFITRLNFEIWVA